MSSLSSGTRLGPYEIVSRLGAGGMGEVYRARDTRLDRTVAVKVLPPSIAGNSDARARFEREARAISALNDPRICTLHDIGSEGDVAYLVMELIEGETLSQVLSRGKLPLERALGYAIEIATALDRAHRQGIVHRDLKPGNVMITRRGLKLLDFGLARQHVTAPGTHDAPTVINPITTEGTILGTLQYMSPEQLEGGATDSRTDIFALGCILYEMVTGRRAFEGASQASIISAIMTAHPPPMNTLVTLTPASLERVVRKCLEKSPDDRWQNAGDLATQLRWICEEPDAPAAVIQRRAASRIPWIIAGAAILASIVLAFLLFRAREADPPTRLMMKLDSNSIDSAGLEMTVAISPDGRHVVYAGRKDGRSSLWLRPLGAANATSIPNTTGARAPFWSPDSREIAYMLSSGKLMRTNLAGDSSATICNTKPGALLHGTWGGDGTIVFSYIGEKRQLHRVPARGGQPKSIAPEGIPADTTFVWPKFVGRSNKITYCTVNKGNDLRLYVMSLDSGDVRDLGPSDSGVQIVDDVMLYTRDGALFAQPLGSDLEREGEPVQLASGISNYVSIGFAGFSATPKTLAFIGSEQHSYATWFNRSGAVLGTVGPNGAVGAPRISHDGRKVALAVSDQATGTADLWTCDLQRNTSMRLTKTPASEGNVAWSPDDQQVAYMSDLDGPPHLFVMRASGGQGSMLTPPRGIQYTSDWSPDGRFIMFSELDPANRRDLWLVAPQPGAKPVLWLRTPFAESQARISPDGTWVLFTSDNTGSREVWAAPFDDPDKAVQISSNGGSQGVWSPDGSSIYYGTPENALYSVPVTVTPSGLEPGTPQLLFRETGGADWGAFDVSRDGQRFLISRTSSGPGTNPLHIIVNWKQLLERQ